MRIVDHAGRNNKAMCGIGTRQRGASTNNFGTVLEPERWNATAEINKCKRCIAAIQKAKAAKRANP